MAKMGIFDPKGMKEFQKKLEKIDQSEMEAFLEGCVKELAARLLRMVVKRTPVGQYPKDSGKKGGTLRRGWTGGRKSGEKAFVDTLSVRHEGGNYVIEVVNPVEYASYVEYGHRVIKREGFGWQPGTFMMTLAEQDLQESAQVVLERRLKKFLGSVLS